MDSALGVAGRSNRDTDADAVMLFIEIKVGCGRKPIGWRLNAEFANQTVGSAVMKFLTVPVVRLSFLSLLER